jgi:hypothetical protein
MGKGFKPFKIQYFRGNGKKGEARSEEREARRQYTYLCG